MKLHVIIMATISLSAIAAPLANKDSIRGSASSEPPLMDAGIDFDFVEKRVRPEPPLMDAGVDFDFVENRASPEPPLMDAGIDFDFVE
ncbi:hypothetical protein BTUL_0034g00300 [Botrytis tulipae]|uniref:Uncharacterized protein n=1 Tax=Botrytis tulipae TaxID=87230 RepID=A0A4Z1EXP1_9HELO|nr:hypothetical protein BTUL_0034g00300 [Botrytis tulipae]